MTFSERWRAFRNRLVADPRFQRFAARFPPTRAVAHRETRAAFDLAAGFVYAQILAAMVDLRAFDALKNSARSAAELAPEWGVEPAMAERLLRAAAALRLTQPCGDGRYTLGLLGAAISGLPGVQSMVRHHALLYADLADPVGLLRRGGGDGLLAQYWAYAGGAGASAGQEAVAPYSTLMAESQAFISADILDSYRIGRHRHLLDIGGGLGIFAEAAARREPRLRVTVFDLPSVADASRSRLAHAFGSDRITVVGGDVFRDPLPPCDAISLVRVLHDHDDAPAQAILNKARGALSRGGRLLIAEPMAGTPGAEPSGDAYFGFYLLAMGSGRPRTPSELIAMAGTAGFRSARLVPTPTPLLVRLIVAEA